MSALVSTGRNGSRPSTRGVRRKVVIGNHLYHIELSSAGISFRQYRQRFTIALPWSTALATAERLAGDDAWRRRELERAARYGRYGRVGRVAS